MGFEMEEKDYEDLIEIVKGYMREYDLSDLAEDRNFLDPSLLAKGVSKLPPPHEHLILLLQAFQLHLKWTDVGTVKRNLERLSKTVNEAPENATMELPARGDSRRVYLTELPALGPLREELDDLIIALRGKDFEPSPTRGLK